jgi:hypothetical protein
VINEPFERAVKGTSYRYTTLLLRLHQDKVKIPYTQLRGFKTFPNRSKEVLKSPSITFVGRAINTRKDLRRGRGIREAPS